MKLALTGQQKKQLNHKISVEIYSIIQISTRIQFELTFYVSDFDCAPEEITNTLSLKPTDAWCKGEKWGPNDIRERNNNFWRYKTSESTNDYHTNIHFKELLEKLEKQKVNLANLPSEAKTGITYVPTCYFPNVGVILEHKLLKRIVNLGLSLDFDIYSLSDNE